MSYAVTSNFLLGKRFMATGGDVLVSGTITTGDGEDEVVTGGPTIILTLTKKLFLASLSTAQKQILLDNMTGSVATTGWDDQVVGNISAATDVVQDSTSQVTITLPANAGYSIGVDEKVTVAIPASILQGSEAAQSATFNISRTAVTASINVSSSILSKDETQIRNSTAYDLVVDITGEILVAAGATFDAQRQNIINNITGDGTSGLSWEDEVKPNIIVTRVARTSDTSFTVTVTEKADYRIGSNETITVTVPNEVIASHDSDVSAGTFSVSHVQPTFIYQGTLTSGGQETDVHTSGETIRMTLTNGVWQSTIGGDNSITDALLTEVASSGSLSTSDSWNTAIGPNLDFNDVVRLTNTVLEITLNDAYPLYGISETETITISPPAECLLAQENDLSSVAFNLSNQTPTVAAGGSDQNEASLVAGNMVITLTLTNGSWKSTVGSVGAATDAIINNISGNDAGATGWDDVITLTASHVTRTSDTVVTIAVPATATYSITANETLTVDVKAAAINGEEEPSNNPTVTISEGVAFSPDNISDLIGWWDANLGITKDGSDNVSDWADQSGNSNDLEQTNGTEQPLWSSSDSDFNNLPSVSFDGSTEEITVSAFSGGDLTQPNTIVMVVKAVTNGSGDYYWDGTASGKRHNFSVSGANWVARAPNNGPIFANDTNSNVIVLEYNGASSEAYLNGGTAVTGGDIGSHVLGGFNIGSIYTFASGHAEIKVAEALIYDKSLSNTEKNDLGNYLGDKYSITWTDI